MEETKLVRKKDLHDLKSSLTAILGYLQLAEHKVAHTELEDQQKQKICELLHKAATSSLYLESQIKKIEGKNDEDQSSL